MAYECVLISLSAPASVDLSAKQFYAATLDTTSGGSKLALSIAAKNMDGILQDKPKQDQAGNIAIFGVTKAAITASTPITAGQLLEVDTGGTLKGTAGGTVVAKALEALPSTPNVSLVTVLILRSNAVFA